MVKTKRQKMDLSVLKEDFFRGNTMDVLGFRIASDLEKYVKTWEGWTEEEINLYVVERLLEAASSLYMAALSKMRYEMIFEKKQKIKPRLSNMPTLDKFMDVIE